MMNRQRFQDARNGNTASTSAAPRTESTPPRQDTLPQVVDADQEAHAKTQALLAAVLEKLDRTAVNSAAPQTTGPGSKDRLAELLSGKPSGLICNSQDLT